MTATTAPIRVQLPHEVIRARCAKVGVPLWRFDPTGHALEHPTEEGLAGTFLASRYLGVQIEQAARAWAADPSPAPIELFPGWWLIPLIESARRRRQALYVGLALEPRALESEEFDAACQSAAIDRAAAAAALSPAATFTPSSVRLAASMLVWSLGDLQAVSRNDEAAASSGRQLTELYEEISLLYKLGGAMNQLEHPEAFIRMACNELHQTMPYAWVAARFAPEQRLCRAMAGKVIVAGELPCDEGVFVAQADRLMSRERAGRAPIAEGDEAGPLAPRGRQVLVLPIVRDGFTIGLILAGDKRGPDPVVSNVDIKLVEAAAGSIGVLLDNVFMYDDQQALFLGVVEALTASIDAKDPYTCGHSERVAHLAARLASAHGLDDEQCERIRIAGLVHDIGKIGVPESVLCKAGKLTDEEFGLIKLHPEIGYDILKDIALLADVLPGVLHHHERYDGRGYPRGLAGEDIPLMARIIGLVDSFDAMSSNRTYRAALPRERVLDEIRHHAGAQFDPALADSFASLDLSHYDELVRHHQDVSRQGGLRTRRRGIAA